jgi:molecular chaperone DnaK
MEGGAPRHINVDLTRAKFDSMTDELVKRTIAPLKRALTDAGITKAELAKVILVGGSTRIPAVAAAVKAETGKDPFQGINPDECVAVGAAIQAGVLAGDVKGILLLDVTPLTLGLETMGNVMTALIKRNTTIPTSASKVFSTAADNQTTVDVHVLQGERPMAADNKTLGRFQLDGIAPAPRGVPQIEVTFDIDANGIVNVKAQDKGTGKVQSVTITSSTNLSDDDINKAIKEAEKYADEDKKRKDLIDSKNDLEQLMFSAEKALKENEDKISAENKVKIEDACEKAKKDLEDCKDADEMKKAFEAFSSVTSPIFTEMYKAKDAADNEAGAAATKSDDTNDNVKDVEPDKD